MEKDVERWRGGDSKYRAKITFQVKPAQSLTQELNYISVTEVPFQLRFHLHCYFSLKDDAMSTMKLSDLVSCLQCLNVYAPILFV